MKIILIGGNGFIGKNLYRYLNSKNYNVIIYDKFIEEEHAQYIKGEINNKEILSKIINRDDIVIHLAGNIVPASSGKNLKIEVEENIIASIILFEICAEKKVKKIIYASSGGAVYGISKSLLIDENSVANPISSYGISKLAVEHYLNYIGRSNDISIINLRIGNPYGYAQKPFTGQGIIATYIASVMTEKEIEIWGDGSSIRDYIYIDDVVEAFEKAILYKGKNSVFNIGTGRGISVNDILSIIRKKLPKYCLKTKYLNELKVEVKRNVLNCQKAYLELDWEARTDMESGIEKMISLWDPKEQLFIRSYKNGL